MQITQKKASMESISEIKGDLLGKIAKLRKLDEQFGLNIGNILTTRARG